MVLARIAALGATGLGWLSIFAVDVHLIRVNVPTPLHNAILGALMVVTVGVVVRHKRRDRGRGYPEGVVDGIKLATGRDEEPPGRTVPGAKVLYLHRRQAAGPCTQRAPKPIGARSL